jgi:gliding motility-associated-like protein
MKFTFGLLLVFLLPKLTFGALVLSCPTDTNVNYQSACQFILGDYTSRVGIVSSDGTTFSNQFPAPGSTITATTSIQITVTDTGGNIQTCSFQVILPPKPTIAFSQTQPFCFDESTGTISPSITNGLAPYSYSWSNGVSSLNLNNVPAGSYTLTVTDALGCKTSNTTTLDQPSKVDLTGEANVYIGGSNVSADGASDGAISTTTVGGVPPYYWEWSNGDVGASIDSLAVGTYKVIVSDMNGCVDTMAFTLTPPFSLTVPGGISPNGDGENDVLFIKDFVKYPDNELTIFDRWGQIVFHAKPYNNDWDGKNQSTNSFAGNELPDGIYFYQIKLQNGKQPTVKGSIVLKRK